MFMTCNEPGNGAMKPGKLTVATPGEVPCTYPKFRVSVQGIPENVAGTDVVGMGELGERDSGIVEVCKDKRLRIDVFGFHWKDWDNCRVNGVRN